MNAYEEAVLQNLSEEIPEDFSKATPKEVYTAVSKAVMKQIFSIWQRKPEGKKACYFSAEFLLGRVIHSNLLNLGLLKETENLLRQHGIDPKVFENIEDDALGNGGLGRLAACFLDSGATLGISLNGYGIRYRYGLFHQTFSYGEQKEEADDWLAFGDPWSVRRENERVRVDFGEESVWAVPYDMPVIGYGGKTINTLRLWQSEPLHPFDFELFNEQKYEEAVAQKNAAERISSVLYPNDDTNEGKRLRLKQQYFFSSASLQTILREFKKSYGNDFKKLPEQYAIQLNDTHPVVSIPELLRLLIAGENLSFSEAFSIAQQVFSYTNHTIMAEALEKWDVSLFCNVLPQVYPYVVMLQNRLHHEIGSDPQKNPDDYSLIADGKIHMAKMAVYATHSVNGVAKIHTEILKKKTLKEWYDLYPERFHNVTNGVTQRRWIALCNQELSKFITDRIGNSWITNLSELEKLIPYADDPDSLKQLMQIKKEKKNQLADYVYRKDHFGLNTENIFDVQVKRLHEYKRQLLNAFSILDLYYGLKEGRIKDFYPTTFIFGGKAAPGYDRAKGIIKYINEIADLINYDDAVNRKIQVVFVSNYDVSYAEKLIPAADFSEQISTAGTEASGTSNMKFMMNGAVTLGTYDGANIEIVEQAGEENNYIFGARVEELEVLGNNYHPRTLYEREPRIRRVMDSLVNGTVTDGGSGIFQELYRSILDGASWHRADNYYLLLDFLPYCETRLRANQDYLRDRTKFTRKCLLNIAHAGAFSSDRTVSQYAKEIWNL